MALALIYFFSAGFAVWGKFNKKTFFKVAKPLPLIILIADSFLIGNFHFTSLSFLIFSLSGDILLLGKSRKFFIYGLTSFLFAHISLILFFVQFSASVNTDSLIIVTLISSFYYFFILRKHLESKLKLPVLLYLAVISAMVILSANFTASVALLFLGSILFYLSDALLAFGKFVKKDLAIETISLSIYYIGQFLIAFSVFNYELK